MNTYSYRVISARGTALVLALVSICASAQPLYRLKYLGALGNQGTLAIDMNATGQASGSAGADAFLWNGNVLINLGAYDGVGDISEGTAINTKGQVTGWAVRPDDACCRKAVLWSSGSAKFLGSLGGRTSFGVDINDSGHVAGYAELADERQHAFIWDGTMMRDLGPFGPSDSSVATAMNAADQVIGLTSVPGGNASAVLWQGNTMRHLGSLGGSFVYPAAINGSGQVTGYSDLASPGEQHAFFWDGTKMLDLGTLGGHISKGFAINNAGQVAGQSSTADGESHAFLWDGTMMRDLGVLGTGVESYANAINSLGYVIGWSYVNSHTEFPPTRAFVSYGGLMQSLTGRIDPQDPRQPYVTLIDAVDINARGQIVAQGRDSGNNTGGAYLLTPLEYRLLFIAPASSAKSKLGTTLRVRFALVDVNGKRITDVRANSLINNVCKVTFSASGAQTRSATCVAYDATADEFFFDWRLGTSGTGNTNLKIAATYKFSMPDTITTTKSRAISIVQ